MLSVTRRKLITGVCAGALVILLSPAELEAWPRRGRAETSFFGNPNVTITAIDTSGGIALSRSSGSLPAFVQVSASAITATGTSRPYEDLQYSWDFGDPSGVEIFTNPVTGGFVNANSAQTGPEAAYCYRTVGTGTKTITLTIRGKNGGGYTSTSVQTTFAVSDFDTTGGGTFYFDSNAAGGGDGTIGSPYNDIHTLSLKVFAAAPGGLSGVPNKILVKRGSVFTCTGSDILFAFWGHVRIDAYGTGAKPIFYGDNITNINSYYPGIFFTSTVSGNRDTFDVVVSNIQLINIDTTNPDARGEGSKARGSAINALQDIYLDNVDQTSGQDWRGNDLNDGTHAQRWGNWGGQMIYDVNLDGNIFFGEEVTWNFTFGVEFVPTGTLTVAEPFPVFEHTSYRSGMPHNLWRWVKFTRQAVQNCIKHSANGSVNGVYKLWSECVITGSDGGIFIGMSNDLATSYNDAVVIEKCLFLNLFLSPVDFGSVRNITFRFNYVTQGSNATQQIWRLRGASEGQIQANIYGNLCYGTRMDMDFSGSITVSTRTQVTYNTFWGTSSDALVMKLVSADFIAANSLMDYNQYYTPNDASNPKTFNSADSGSTKLSMASWQALGPSGGVNFDQNGSYLAQAPTWPDPANGNFGQRVA